MDRLLLWIARWCLEHRSEAFTMTENDGKTYHQVAASKGWLDKWDW